MNLRLHAGPFTQDQLIQLRAQILAYKYLSRNIPLPPNILQGIRGAPVCVLF